MNPYVLTLIALIGSLFSAAMWYAFVRPAPQGSGIGIITRKTFQPARTIKRFQGGAKREVWTQQDIKVPDSYVFAIRVEGLSTELQYSIPKAAGETYKVGQTVSIRYFERSIPLIWKRMYVTDMAPAEQKLRP